MMITKPNIFLLGAPKCGTTALAKYLGEHPFIYVSQPKEPHYFCKDYLKAAGGFVTDTDEEYLETFFPGLSNSNSVAAVDTSVWYLYSKVAITEILGFNPEARFLVMLRNPVDMAWSLHSMFNFQGQEDHADFMTAWQLQEKRKKGLAIPSGLWLDQEMLLYKDVCSLGTQLKRVLNIVEKERVHVEIIDDLKTNPRNAYLRVLDFINIPDDGRATFPVKNSGRKIKNPALVKLLRTRTARKTAEMLKRILNLRTLGIGRPDLVMPPEIHKFLITEFKDEIVLLEDLIARDLISWRHWTRK